MIDFASIFYLCLEGIQKKALIIFLKLQKNSGTVKHQSLSLAWQFEEYKKYTV